MNLGGAGGGGGHADAAADLRPLRVRVLGGLEVEGLEPRRIGSRKARTLLKVLAVARGAPVPVDRLADALWGDEQPATPADQIGVLVSRLRRALGTERLTRSDAGYALRADWLDVTELDARAADAAARLRAGGYGAARVAAEAALQLVRGPLVADADAPWADRERAAVDRVVAGVRLIAAEAAHAVGDPAGAADAAEGALEHDPYDEAALRLLMRAHVAAGRPASALAGYARARERLAEDLGVSPAPETEELHRRILLEEPVAGPAPAPAEPLVGRDAELAVLDRILGEVIAAGGGAGVVIEGEAGIGKTAVVRGFAARAEAAGAVVLFGRCDELGLDLPLQPVVDGLATHLRAAGAEAEAAALGAEARVVGPLLGRGQVLPAPAPAAAAPAGSEAATVVFDRGAAQAVLFAALLAVVERLGEGAAAVVVIVDDLHLAAPSTVEWLRLAARRGRGVLVVTTRRPGGAPSLPEATGIGLGPLDLEAARRLVGSDRAAALHARSGGHPLLLLALAGAAGEELPATIRQAVTARAAALGPAAPTVRAAAVLGPEVDLDLIVTVLGVPAATLLDHLEAAVADGLLEERGAAFVFSHDLVREALAAVTTASRRAYLHREAARVLAARPRPDPLAVARHARLGGDVDVAVAALVSGAEAAAARYDGAGAERLLDDALALAATPAVHLARARMRLGRLDYDGARADADAALAFGAVPEALEVGGWVAYYRRDFDAALRYADEAIHRAGAPALRASCLALAGRIRHSQGNLAEADARLTDALAVAPAEMRGVAQVWLAALRAHQGRPPEAAALSDLGLLDADRLGHPFARFHGLFARAYAGGQTGKVAAGLAAVDALDEAIGRHGGERFRPVAANLRGWLLRGIGDDAADDWNARAVADAIGDAFAEPRTHGLLDLAEGRLAAGDPGGATRLLEQAEGGIVAEGTMVWHQRERAAFLRARLALAAGELDAAGAAARSLAAEAGARGSRRYELLGGALAAHAALLAGDPVDADAVDRLLTELDGVAGIEVWRVTAELAAASGQARWWAQAERRAKALVAGAGPAGERTAAWVARRLDALRPERP